MPANFSDGDYFFVFCNFLEISYCNAFFKITRKIESSSFSTALNAINQKNPEKVFFS